VPYTCASTDKAKALLGYSAEVAFDEGIRRTVAWYNEKEGLESGELVRGGGGMARKEKQGEVKRVVSGENLTACA
jgi:dTDP-D-glucose 4,6-dehydratase